MRPTIALACILKNEAHNLGPMLQSVRGCFDEIVLVDTGSTDGSVEFIEKVNALVAAGDPSWAGIPKITIGHFEWVKDFSKARQHSFDLCKSEYIMWMDLDDALSDNKQFIEWRDTVLHTAHYWAVDYNYAYDDQGRVECQFIRERVVKNHFGFRWKYFVHEGILQTEGKQFWPAKVTTWTINHRRTEQDRQVDNKRNLLIFDNFPYETLEPRMKYYYGKELVENGMAEKAGRPLMDALKDPDLELHDRIMALQYAAQAALASKAYEQVVQLCYNCLQLMSSRAESWCLIGDAYLQQSLWVQARQAYKYALACSPDPLGGTIVVHKSAYFDYPHTQLAHIALTVGDYENALPHITALKGIDHPHAVQLEQSYHSVKDMSTVRRGLPEVRDIAIICPPQGAITDWDENSAATKGFGGSETAAIEVAKSLHRKTGRPVKIFQPRAKREKMASGVEYIPSGELQGYIQNVKPSAVINWRHPTRLSEAPTYIWCHDLICPRAENVSQYDKIFALSEFHKNYLHQTQGIPFDKIRLLFNGVNPADFEVGETTKNPNKIIFSSSPDRGLDRSILIVEKARQISGLDLELHCFYGFANMRKMGGEMEALSNKIEKMIAERPWVKYHGMVVKKDLMKHFKEAAVWIYPANFIETYCITAIEALVAGVWPIVRDMGALKYTMKEAIDRGICDIMNVDCESEAEVGIWANRVVSAVVDQKYKHVHVKAEDYSWDKVADKFIEELRIG